jgi:hypothetical protein
MKLKEVADKLGLDLKSTGAPLDADVQVAYASDILSDVMSRAREGSIWITLQTHANIVAVADLKSLAGIILVAGRQPEEDTLEKANGMQVPIFTTNHTAFEIAGRLYEIGIKG